MIINILFDAPKVPSLTSESPFELVPCHDLISLSVFLVSGTTKYLRLATSPKVSFSAEWNLETKIWALEMLITNGMI